LKLSKKESTQIDKGLEITFMHLREIIKDPKKLNKYKKDTDFFPVYLKEKGKEALLLGIKPKIEASN
jgi:hypothetical protein